MSDNYTNLDNLTDTQLINWLEKQQLLGLSLTLARRFAKLHAVYWRQKQEYEKASKAVKEIRKSDCGAWRKDCSIKPIFTCLDGQEKRNELACLLDKLYKVVNV